VSETTRRWPRPARWAARLAWPAAAIAGLGWLLSDRLTGLDLSAVLGHAAAVPASAIAAALGFTVLSHAALSLYDVAALRRIGPPFGFGRAALGGFVATTLGQSLGLSPLVGALARWRMHHAAGLDLAGATLLTAWVSAGFWVGAVFVVAAAALAAPAAAGRLTELGPWTAALAAAAALAALGGLARAMRRGLRSLRLGRRRVTLPDGAWMRDAALLTAADLVPAAAALWALLPAGTAPPFAELLLVYVVALAFGFASGAPAGAGAFEGALLLALPFAPAEPLLAACALYRLIYHGPTALAALALLWRAGAPRRIGRAAARLPDGRETAALSRGDRAEAALAWTGDKRIALSPCGGAAMLYGVRGRRWIALGDPHGAAGARAEAAAAFLAAARAAGARPAIYKAAEPALWLGLGLRLQPLGEEASVDPRGFDLRTPARRELRRKIGQAGKAGVRIVAHPPGRAPLGRLAPVAAAWRLSRGGDEMGFSMGRFDPDWLRRHPVFEALVGDRTVAFLSVCVSADGSEHMLDLMRPAPDAPHGTMHLLTLRAIEAAEAAGARRFNLCMAPLSGLERLAPVTPLSRVGRLIYERADGRRGLAGLRRFKDSFRPDWTPRYLAADGLPDAVGALVAARALVAAPAPPIDVQALTAAQAFLDADLDLDPPSAAEPDQVAALGA
jgi:phosphatidylglycerol lysyltransferase